MDYIIDHFWRNNRDLCSNFKKKSVPEKRRYYHFNIELGCFRSVLLHWILATKVLAAKKNVREREKGIYACYKLGRRTCFGLLLKISRSERLTKFWKDGPKNLILKRDYDEYAGQSVPRFQFLEPVIFFLTNNRSV